MEQKSFLHRQLRSFDLFKKMPSNVTKGSIFGVIMTILCFAIVGMLFLNELINFMSTDIESGLRIDHRKEETHVPVNLDIVLHSFPCHLMGLDVVDFLETHRVGVHDNLKYVSLDPNGNEIGEVNMEMSDEDTIKEFDEAYNKGYGCRIVGKFEILLVPGNFHIAFHSKGALVERILSERGPFAVDLTHTIKDLSFGMTTDDNNKLKRDFNLKSVHPLRGFHSSKMVNQPGAYTYRYKLLIVPTDLIYENGAQQSILQYKTFWNVAMMEPSFNYQLYFDYDLSSMSMTERQKHKYKSEFIVHIAGIIGGLIAFMSFLHNLLQKSVIRLILKHGMGKLE